MNGLSETVGFITPHRFVSRKNEPIFWPIQCTGISVTPESFSKAQLTSNDESEISGRIRKVPLFLSPFSKYC